MGPDFGDGFRLKVIQVTRAICLVCPYFRYSKITTVIYFSVIKILHLSIHILINYNNKKHKLIRVVKIHTI